MPEYIHPASATYGKGLITLLYENTITQYTDAENGENLPANFPWLGCG